MNGAGDTLGPCGLNLLLFSVAGVHFGVDADQVEGTFACQGEASANLLWFHREMGYGDDAIIYTAPVVIGIKTGKSQDYRVVIDRMEDIAGIAVKEIHPFPPLMEPFALRNGMWGIVVKGDRMIILVDFLRLLENRRAPDALVEVHA